MANANIKSILQNERYTGDALLQKTYITDCISKKSRKNKGELPKYLVENHHEAIISHKDFNRVQQEMARRKSKRVVAEKIAKGENGKYSAKFAMSELLFCGECGSHYRRVTWTAKGFKEIKPTEYKHIADGFRIVIKTAEDFTPEISRIIRTTLTDMRLNLAVQHSDTPDWTKCESEKVENIRRKIKAVMLVDANDALNQVVGIYVDCYISGLEIMSNLLINFPEIYEDVFQLEQSYKREVSIKTLMNTDKTMNRLLFDDILKEFQSKLERGFSRRFTEASIGELKHDLIASWLADCSMEFRSE